jgi:hypothetical protein
MMPAQIDYVQLVQQFGIMGALLVSVLVAIYRMGKWLAANVVKPLADRHLVFIERIEKVQVEQSATLQSIAKTQERLTEMKRDEIDQLKAIRAIVLETKEDQIRGRTTAVQQIQEEHAEILRRLPQQQP